MIKMKSDKAASEAVTRALKTQKQVTARRKTVRKPVNPTDLESQVNKLKLYREPNHEDDSVLSSSSSNSSDANKSTS